MTCFRKNISVGFSLPACSRGCSYEIVPLSAQSSPYSNPSGTRLRGSNPGFCSTMRSLGVFLLPSGWDASRRKVTPQDCIMMPRKVTGTHLYSWAYRGTVGVLCLAQQHGIMTPASAQTLTARNEIQRANH